ncbi:MAG: glycosyltransferase family 4 protein [Candidatus Wallbacteria bacterium]
MKKNILFITPYFPPEIGAPQSRISELAKKMMQRGYNVKIICAFPNYPSGIIPKEYIGKKFLRQSYNGFDLLRTYIYATPNKGFLKRLVGHLTFAASSFLGYAKYRKEINADIAIIESPPLFMGFTAIALRLLFGLKYVFNVSDVWPDSAVELGMLKNKFLISCSSALEKASYYYSSAVACVTRGIISNIENKNVAREKLFFLPNGVDTDFFSSAKDKDGFYDLEKREFINKFELEDKFVVLYSGTLGISQNLGFLMDIAEKFRDNEKIKFLIVGDGAEREKLIQKKEKLNLKNVCFERLIPKAKMPALIASAGACVVSLLDIPVFRGALPSKMYEYMAMQKPIVMFAVGECADLLNNADAGLVSKPDDLDSACANIEKLAEDKAVCQRLGANAEKFVKQNFSRDVICDYWEKMLQNL